MKNERGFVTTVAGVMMGVTILALALALSGCGKICVSLDRTDVLTETRTMIDSKPWYMQLLSSDKEGK